VSVALLPGGQEGSGMAKQPSCKASLAKMVRLMERDAGEQGSNRFIRIAGWAKRRWSVEAIARRSFQGL